MGAYMGYGTVRMSRALSGNQSKIVAAEADPQNIKLLNRNIECNKLPNVIVVPKAIWKEETTLTFYKSGRQANSVVNGIVEPQTSISVDSTTIDKITADLDLPEVNIVNLTLNGAEVEALQGMKCTLAKSRDIRLSAAGWYSRQGKKISEIIGPFLIQAGLRVAIGRDGLVLAWK